MMISAGVFPAQKAICALPPKADIGGAQINVR
jgi:hypothetical protein